MRSSLPTVDIYMNKVFKRIIIGICVIALTASLSFLTLKFLGFYENVEGFKFVLFIITTLFYFVIGFVITKAFDKVSETPDRTKVIRIGKIFIAFMEIIQWNYISYAFPSEDFWGYYLFFLLLVAFFLDHKYVLYMGLLLFVSMVISWFVYPAELLPAVGPLLVANMILRVIVIFLGFLGIWSLTFIIQSTLVKDLEEIADYDPLTTLKNRRTLTADLEKQVIKAKKNECFLSVMMCDIDDFKILNDENGHDVGDIFLKNISNIIKYRIKDKGEAYRYGGEEIFCIINLNEKDAYAFAESIRKEVNSMFVDNNGKRLNTTLTIGVSNFSGTETTDELIKNSDINLYYGKKHGKNVVIN